MNVTVEYGTGTKSFDAAGLELKGILGPAAVRGLTDVPAKTQESLSAPIGASAFREVLRGRSSALILTVDNTRPSPTPLLRPILSCCERANAEVTICIAIGRHRPMREDEIEQHLGRELCGRYRVVQHDPFDDARHRDLGQTSRGTPVKINEVVFEHDLVVGVGIVEPSYLCGFSGGRKLILPGIAHHSTIDANHFLLREPETKIGKLEGNPLSEDATEASRKVPLDWITYAVVGPNDGVVEVLSGDPYEAHEAACRRSFGLYRVKRELADIVVASPGGAPYDCDLVQGKKGIIPAAECVKPGGTIIIAAECPEGWGAESTFAEWVKSYEPREIVARAHDKAQFSLGAHGANILARPVVEKQAHVIFVTCEEMVRELDGTFLTATTDLEEAVRLARARTGEGASLLAIRRGRRLIVED